MPLIIIFCKIVIKMVSWRKSLEHFLGQLHSVLQCAASGATDTPWTSGGSPEHLLLVNPLQENAREQALNQVFKLPRQRPAQTGMVVKSPL